MENRTNRKLFGSRDRFGKKPFFYSHRNGAFVFGSELSAVRMHPAVSETVSRPALKKYFGYGYEGMPNVVLEAMSCGCAVLASRVPGNDAVVQDGVTGWLFDLNDSEGFQKRILDIVSNPQLARDAGSAGRLRVEQEFSWSRAAQSYLELLGGRTPISSPQ